MPSNISVDDYSPLIQYEGQWVDSFNLTSDPFTSQYQERSFHSSMTNGSTASIEFKGTAVYIFGAKRGNHGYYSVTVDGQPSQQFDGYAPVQSDGTDGVYQYPLFVRERLKDGKHKVTLTNIVNGDRAFVDIDYIVWTQESDLAFNYKVISDAEFEYSGPTVMWSVISSDRFQGKNAHSTSTYGAAAALNFDGSEIFLYGRTGPRHGTYMVQVDNQPAMTLNATSPVAHLQALLYTTSGLSDGSHRIVITNNEEGKVLDIDYANVLPHTHTGVPPSAIAGIAVGIVAGLTVLALTWWCFFYRHRHNSRRLSTDLLDPSPIPMRSYSDGRNQMVVEPFVDAPPLPPATSPSSVDLRTEGAHSIRKGHIVDWSGQGVGSRISDISSRSQVGLDSQGASPAYRAHEVDAGALPPMYDQIVPSNIAEMPARNVA